MRSIRARLLAWLLPPLLALIALIFLFFYFSQSDEIAAHYRHHLETIVKSASLLVSPEDVLYLKNHEGDPNLEKDASFLRIYNALTELKKRVPAQSIYIVSIQKVLSGETVIREKPEGHDNPKNSGQATFRQIYLVDTAIKESGHTDFSESGEEAIYQTKKPFVTSLYKTRASLTPTLTGYAPILSKEGDVIALVGADLDLTFFESSLQASLIVIVIAAIITIGLLILSSILVALKITSPVHKLNEAALVLAAGDYSEPINVVGPQEIEELATTLNTLRECLIDTVTRLSDINLSKEKLYGENECRELLDYYMVEEVLNKTCPKNWRAKEVRLPKSPAYGMWLALREENSLFNIHLKEATRNGFSGTFSLLVGQNFQELKLSINSSGKIEVQKEGPPLPLLWSSLREKFVPLEAGIEPRDYLIFYNQGALKQLGRLPLLMEWLSKIFRHFAREGFDLALNMCASELKFLAKKNFHHEDIRFIIFQRLE